MISRTVGFAILLVLAASSAEACTTIEVNFDQNPFGGIIDTSMPINSVYAPLGIHFAVSGPGCTNATDVFANPDQPAGFGSSPNVVTLCQWTQASDISENVFGLIEVTLDQAAVSVCIDVDPPDPLDYAVLRAYDESDGLLAEVFSTPGTRMTMCASAIGIRKVEFSGAGSHWARFDDFAVTYGDFHSINFEVDTASSPVAPGTVINNLYAPWGVTFAAVGQGQYCGPDVYASDYHPGDFGTPGNLVSTCSPPFASDISERNYKIVEASFDPPACTACINVRPDDPSDRAFLRAYDQNGHLIGEELSEPGLIQTLCISDLVMSSVQFSGYQDGYCRFDDLFYLSANGTIDAPARNPLPAGLQVESVVPNPSRGAAWVTFRARPQRPAMLQLIDASGRTVTSRWLAGGSETSRRIEIGNGERLPAGVYWIRLSQGGETVSKKWVVLE